MTPETLDRFASGTSAGAPALRTLRASEALDEALRTYRVLAPALLRRSAVPSVFVLASVLFWVRAFGPRLLTTNSPGDVTAQVGEAGFVLIVGLLIATPLLVFGIVEATLQAVALANPFREGLRADEIAASSAARRAFPRAFGAGLWTFALAGAIPLVSFGLMAAGSLLPSGNDDQTAPVLAVLGVIGMFFGVLAAPWIVAAHALAPAAVLRGDGAFAACRRSRRLMAGVGRVSGGYGMIWTVYIVLLVAALAEWGGIRLLQSSIPGSGALPGGGVFSEALSLGVPFVVAWTLLPLWGTSVAVIDAERRVRKEGYDVELLRKG